MAGAASGDGASCPRCDDELVELADLCQLCGLCELCCRCSSPGLDLVDLLSDMQDEDRSYFWERY